MVTVYGTASSLPVLVSKAVSRTAVFATSIAARLSDGRALSRDDSERTEGQRLRIGLEVFQSKVPNRDLEVLPSVVF